jgi:hypothetical protein
MSAAAKKAKLPVPDCDEEAQRLLGASDSTLLGPAISVCEAAGLTKSVLRGIGIGSHPDGIMLLQCTTAAEAAACRKKIVDHLVAADQSLAKIAPPLGAAKKAERTANSKVTVGRMLVSLMSSLTESDRVNAPAVPPGGANYIVTQTEEERGFSLQSYDAEEAKTFKGLLLRLHNIKLLPHECASQPTQKKCAYWARNEGCFADPNKVPLSAFKQRSCDSNYTLFARMIWSHATPMAGELVKEGIRDDDAGYCKAANGNLWLHGDRCIALLKELTVLRDELDDAQLGHITEVMYQLLHKATSTGQISGSLSMTGQIAKMPEYLEAQRCAADAGAAKRGSRKRGGEAPSTPVKTKKAKAAAGTPPGKKATSEKKGGRFPDTEGADGPNSLPRMKGGNPAGSPCKDLAEGKCPFKTCSFSHK